MRVYVPLTLPRLAEAYQAGELGPGPLDAYAVTPALREWYVSDDIEELEYAALNRAAVASLRLIAGEPDAPRRRVVVALDVPDGAAVADPDRGLDPARSARCGSRTRCRWPRPRRCTWTPTTPSRTWPRRPRRSARRTRATTTRGSPWTAPRTTSCSGSPPRRSPNLFG